ncbi:hypothetical protein D9758_013351 [Tetrapyrgos nigripes]|uniref:Protein kinase domain-containing protein n=1 Tax=Tetrapyrgos nigripes TaxID=182062 RepID=A0A8H5CLG1_9AGAR|nr:hypothetical protein D9758_013351 [Tetrapyrgos nigripes]
MSDEVIAAHDPGRRAQLLKETLAILHSISPQDEEKNALQPLLKLKGKEAQYQLDILQTRVRFLTLKTIFRLSQESEQYPSCYVIKNLLLGKRIARGTYGVLYEGKFAIGGKSETGIEGPNRIDYAAKVVGLYPGVTGTGIGDCLREAVLWRQLTHPNMLPFLGMYYQDDNRQDVCFVSPYMNNGSLEVLLRVRTLSQEDMCNLMHDIASGLEYLHGENVIHGDLKPGNVLITNHFRACLCDFGQSRLASTKGFRPTRQGGGTFGYMAPEVSKNARTSKKSDVYSFGHLCHEILKKMYDLPDLRWLSEDSHQVDPTRPEKLPSARDLDLLWDMILQCLDEKPSVRPDAKELISRLNGMSLQVEAALDWDVTDPLFTQVRGNVDHGDMSLRLPVPADQTPPTTTESSFPVSSGSPMALHQDTGISLAKSVWVPSLGSTDGVSAKLETHSTTPVPDIESPSSGTSLPRNGAVVEEKARTLVGIDSSGSTPVDAEATAVAVPDSLIHVGDRQPGQMTDDGNDNPLPRRWEHRQDAQETGSYIDKAHHLNDLGNALQRRFEPLGELGDIELAIRVMQQAVDLTPDAHADKARRLNDLGDALQRRFERLGELGDIELAIRVMQQAVDLTPDGHADKAHQLNNLGNALQRRFERLGELGDIELAIRVMQQAVDLTPGGHADKARRLNDLGNALQCRFERLGELGDIELAIRVMQQAVDLTPDGHAGKAYHLNDLGNALQRRYERLGELGDIELAIRVMQQAVDLTPDGHADKAHQLNDLGNALQRRFQHLESSTGTNM